MTKIIVGTWTWPAVRLDPMTDDANTLGKLIGFALALWLVISIGTVAMLTFPISVANISRQDTAETTDRPDSVSVKSIRHEMDARASYLNSETHDSTARMPRPIEETACPAYPSSLRPPHVYCVDCLNESGSANSSQKCPILDR
jgi:hypothetical protein